MALAPTLYDFQLQLSDTDRGVDVQQTLKVARHPSETMERLWLRVLAYCWRYEERLGFTAGLSDPDAPDLQASDLTGRTTQWIRVGKTEPAKVRRAVTQNSGAKVSVLFDSPERMESFLSEAALEKITHLDRASLAAVDEALLQELSSRDRRRVKLSVTLVGDHFYLDVDGDSFDGPLSHAAGVAGPRAT